MAGPAAEPPSLLNSILPAGSLKWLAIILAAILVIVVIWLLWPRRTKNDTIINTFAKLS